MGDAYRIEAIEALRKRMGEPNDVVKAKVDAFVDDYARDYIARSPFLVLSTADADGRQDASPKGDGRGFVIVHDEKTLLIPDRKGNKLLFGLENILANPQVGLLFLIPGTDETLRINGRAELTEDPQILSQLAARGQEALLAIRVHVEECFFHCAKAFRRSELWNSDSWQPHKVSLGEQFARRIDRAGDKELIETLETAIETNNREEL